MQRQPWKTVSQLVSFHHGYQQISWISSTSFFRVFCTPQQAPRYFILRALFKDIFSVFSDKEERQAINRQQPPYSPNLFQNWFEFTLSIPEIFSVSQFSNDVLYSEFNSVAQEAARRSHLCPMVPSSKQSQREYKSIAVSPVSLSLSPVSLSFSGHDFIQQTNSQHLGCNKNTNTTVVYQHQHQSNSLLQYSQFWLLVLTTTNIMAPVLSTKRFAALMNEAQHPTPMSTPTNITPPSVVTPPSTNLAEDDDEESPWL